MMYNTKHLYELNPSHIMGIPAKQSFVRGMKECFNGIPPVLLIILGIALLISPVLASEVRNPFTYRNITPQNDPKEFVVMPMDTIYLGGTYDLTNVKGISKQFAWWSDWKIEATDCNPTIVNSVSYVETNGAVDYKKVYIDPAKYRLGNWYQWDGCYTHYSKIGGTQLLPYIKDNNLAFRIINPPPTTPAPTPIPTPRPVISTPAPTPIPVPVVTAPIPVKPGFPWWNLIIVIGILTVIVFVVVI